MCMGGGGGGVGTSQKLYISLHCFRSAFSNLKGTNLFVQEQILLTVEPFWKGSSSMEANRQSQKLSSFEIKKWIKHESNAQTA